MGASQQVLLGIQGGPPVGGFTAWYDYQSWNNTTKVWSDKSGNGHNVSCTNTTYVNSASISGNGSSKTIDCIDITSNGSGTFGTMLWPSAILPSTYTLFHVCRYSGASGVSQRIIQGYVQNWLSGFWSNNHNSFYHNGWISAIGGYGYNSNWRYSTDQNNLGRQQGTTYGTSGAGTPSYDRITINQGASGEPSECSIAEVIVYSSTLTSTQYEAVETYLKNRYGL